MKKLIALVCFILGLIAFNQAVSTTAVPVFKVQHYPDGQYRHRR